MEFFIRINSELNGNESGGTERARVDGITPAVHLRHASLAL